MPVSGRRVGKPAAEAAVPTGPLVLEHQRGWPAAVGRGLLLTSLPLLLWALGQPAPSVHLQVDPRAYWLEVVTLQILGALLLLLWRRGVVLDRQRGVVGHWWGLAGLRGPLMLRRGVARPLVHFTGVRVLPTRRHEHYKRFAGPVFHVQLEAAEPLGGQLALRERFIVDDEQPDAAQAQEVARQVAAYLELSLVDATRDGA